MTAARRQDRRRAELGAIHAGRKALGWDDETYRGVLEQITGKTSARELSADERARVLDCMRERGFQRTGRSASWSGGSADTRPQLAKLRELWAELAALGELRDPTEVGLRAYVRRMTKVQALEWLSVAQASDAIEGLKAWIARAATTKQRDAATRSSARG